MSGKEEERERLNAISRQIIGACIAVHKTLGPGLLESAYETCVAYELRQLGLKVEQQKPMPIVYRNVKLDCGYRPDLTVEDSVIVEAKAIDKLAPIHEAQLMSYLRLADCRLGLLVNFNVRLMRDGIKRIVNGF